MCLLKGIVMTYTPNLKDPRILKRIQTAYGFARGVLSSTESHSWSTRYIDKYFGQQQNQLSKWLREQLLVCTSDRYNKDAGKTKEYKLNESGANYIREVIKGNTLVTCEEWIQNNPKEDLDILYGPEQRTYDEHAVAMWIQKEFGSELESGNFNYDDKSGRLWHPMQSVRRCFKKRILAEHNLTYHYDIQCAAPTLIHQHAQKQEERMDLYLFALRRYLSDRNQVRTELAKAIEVDMKTVKVLINALFCGARLGNNPEFALSQLLGNDSAKIAYLKENEFITQLRDDIKTCWTYIEPSMSRTSIVDKNSRTRMLPVSSKQKWARYFDLERTILNHVIDYMKQRDYSYFLEHDGWACSNKLDVNDLSDYVYNSSGYRVIFESELVRTKIDSNQFLRDLVEVS